MNTRLYVIYTFNEGFVKVFSTQDMTCIQSLESLCIHLSENPRISKVELFRQKGDFKIVSDPFQGDIKIFVTSESTLLCTYKA